MSVANLVTVLTLMVCVFLSELQQSQGVSQNDEDILESKIITDILINSGYVREARPVSSANQSVNVDVYPYFIRVNEIHEHSNTFSASLIFMQMWTDSRLKWNATKYGGSQKVRLPSAKIWLPDIVPYNTASTGNPDPLYEETVTVTSNGGIIWGPLLTVSSMCPFDVTYFPFDSQTCTMHFGSWHHDMTEINIMLSGTDAKETEYPMEGSESTLAGVKHPNWDIVDNKVTGKLSELQFGVLKYRILSLTANVQRRASFYKYLAIGPGALLGFLVPVMFLLPARCQEKNTFGMLLMIGLILLISVLAEAVPLNHGSTPRVGLFYLATMVLITFSMVISILISNLSYRGLRRKALPHWLHRAFLSRNGIRRLLCIDQYAPVDNLFAETMRGLEHHTESNAHVEPEIPGVQELDNVGKLESQFKDITKYLRYICGKMSAEGTYKNVISDWEEVARVVDRVLFILFFIFYALTAVSMLT